MDMKRTSRSDLSFTKFRPFLIALLIVSLLSLLRALFVALDQLPSRGDSLFSFVFGLGVVLSLMALINVSKDRIVLLLIAVEMVSRQMLKTFDIAPAVRAATQAAFWFTVLILLVVWGRTTFLQKGDQDS